MRQSGVALLLTLSSLLVLTIALTASLERRSKEARMIGALDQNFQVEVASRSAFRALLKGLREVGPWQLMESPLALGAYKHPTIPHGYTLNMPLGNSQLDYLVLRPMDHLFDLNQSISATNLERSRIFINLVQGLNKEEPVWVQDAEAALGELIDFTDTDSLENSPFTQGMEMPKDHPLQFLIKNRPLERLEEVVLLPSFRKLKVNPAQRARNFRVVPRPCQEAGLAKCDMPEQIDVNLATKAELEAYLDRFQGMTGYEAVLANKERLVALFLEGREGLKEPKYGVPLNQRDGLWQKELENAGISLSTKEKALFTSQTSLLWIEMGISQHRYRRQLKAVVQLHGEGGDISKIRVLAYRLD